MATKPDWSHLPALALSCVFSYLSSVDRLSAGAVCRHWSHSLHDPIIWRDIHVRLDDFRDVRAAIACQCFVGSNARSLDLALSRARHGLVFSTRVAKDAAFYIHTVRKSSTQFHTIQLRDWMYCYRWQKRYKLVFALHRLLAAQRRLNRFTLHNALFTVGEVRRVLLALEVHCRATLEALDLRSAFCRPLYYTPRYLPPLAQFIALCEFKVDYSALRDHVLDDLSLCPSMRILDITVRNTDQHNHCLSNSTWTQLRKRSQLKVHLHIFNLAYYEDVCFLLVPSMPLAYFQMISGCVWDQRRSRNFRMTLNLLLNNYHHCLEHLHLKLKNNMENLDDLILRCIDEFENLINFEYEAILRDFSTIQRICQGQLSSEMPYKVIFVEPHSLTSTNRNKVKIIYQDMGKDLAKRSINLKIKDPSKITYY